MDLLFDVKLSANNKIATFYNNSVSFSIVVESPYSFFNIAHAHNRDEDFTSGIFSLKNKMLTITLDILTITIESKYIAAAFMKTFSNTIDLI